MSQSKKSLIWAPYSESHKDFITFYFYFLANRKNYSLKYTDFNKFKIKPRQVLMPYLFIFHAGRTGSTLFTRYLKALSSVEIFSEIDLVSNVFWHQRTFTAQQKQNALMNLFNAYIKAIPSEKKCIFKFTSIDTINLELITKCYPDVPWIYIYNDPQRILSSQFLRPPRWLYLLPQMCKKLKLKIDKPTNTNQNIINQMALILDYEFEQVLKLTTHNSLLIGFEQVLTKIEFIFSWAKIDLTKKDLLKIAEVSKFDAKSPNKKFNLQKRAAK